MTAVGENVHAPAPGALRRLATGVASKTRQKRKSRERPLRRECFRAVTERTPYPSMLALTLELGLVYSTFTKDFAEYWGGPV
jgi:hypothetical protein